MRKTVMTTHEKLELLPCPFCNGPAVDVGAEYITCGAGWNSDCAGHQVKASREGWNTRQAAQSTNETEAFEFLRNHPDLPADIDNDTIRAFINLFKAAIAEESK